MLIARSSAMPPHIGIESFLKRYEKT